MFRITGAVLAMLALAPALRALDDAKEKPKTPAEQVKALEREYKESMDSFMKAYRAAKPEERQKLFQEKYPQPAKFAQRFFKIAEDNPKDPGAVAALAWVIGNNTYDVSKNGLRNKSLDLLTRNHADSAKLGPVCESLGRSFDKTAADFLHAALKNPHREVQAEACMALAHSLEGRVQMHQRLKDNPRMVQAYEGMLGKENVEHLQKLDVDKTNKQAQKYLERVVKDYADVKAKNGKKLGDLAESQLDALRHPILVGKAAPEIKGEDLDGKKFKLSDYKGKVVLLDFWGNW